MPFDPSTATAVVEPPVAGGFDPSTAKPVIEDSIRAAPEEGMIHKGLRTARESLSPLLGKTEEQQLREQSRQQGFAAQFPSIAKYAGESASDVETKGFLPEAGKNKTAWTLPTLEGEAVRETSNPLFEVLMAPVEKEDPASLKVAKALYTPLAHTINALTSPLSLMTLGIGSGAGAVGKAAGEMSLSAPLVHSVERSVAGIFASMMAESLVESVPGAVEKYNDPKVDPAEKLKAGIEITLNAAMMGLAGLGAYKGIPSGKLAGKSRVEQAKALAEASGKSVEEVAQDAQANFDQLLKAPGRENGGNLPANAKITVMEAGGKRAVQIDIPGENSGDRPVFSGTPEQAKAAGFESVTPFDELKEGTYTYSELPPPPPETKTFDPSTAQPVVAVEGTEPNIQKRRVQIENEQEAEHVETARGLGPATAEEMAPKKTLTGIKNEFVDADRAKRGLAPAMDAARRGFGEVWDKAMAEVDANPSAADDIIARQQKQATPMTDVEAAILTHRKIDLENAYDKIAARLIEGKEIGSEVTLASDRAMEAKLSDQLQELYEATKSGGTETARGLNARKLMANEDYSLAKMTTKRRAAKGGDSLTPAEKAEVQADHDKIKATQKAIDEHEAGKATTKSEKAADEAIAAMDETLKKEDPKQAAAIDVPKDRAKTLDRIKKAVTEKKPLGDLGSLLQRLAEQFLREGVKGREPLLDAVHAAVKDIMPDVSRRQIMDALSGYGEFSPLNPDAIKAELRDLKGQMQQVAKIEDMEAGQAPKKTGVERREPSDDERRLIKQVNELKRKGGFTVTDPAKQLKSALDAIKTRLTNSIADLTHQIETKTRIIKDKTTAPSDPVVEQLRKQHDELKRQFDEIFQKPDLTDAQRLDMASKAADRQIAELERQLRTDEVFPGGKKDAPSSPALEAKKAQIEALKKERQYARDRISSPEVLSKDESSLNELKARLKKRVTDLDEQVAAGKKTVKESKDFPLDPEADALIKLRDEAQAHYDEVFKKADLTPEERLKLAEKSADRSIEELERQLRTGELFTKGKSEPLSGPELDAKRARIEALKEEREYARDLIQPKNRKTPDEIALAALKTRLRNRTAELQEKLANQDFAPRKRGEPPALDQEAEQLKAENLRARRDFEIGNLKHKLENRTSLQKAKDVFVKWRRGFLLSSPVTLVKLTAAAATRMATSVSEEGVGYGISKLLPEIAKRAPREGGASIKIEAQAAADGIILGMKDAAQILKTGESDLGILYGRGKDSAIRESDVTPREAIDFFGNIHGALKSPAKRAEFSRSYAKRAAHALANGIDITDPMVQTRLATEAYKDANRSIFLQDNRVVDAWNALVSRLQMADKVTGEVPPVGTILGGAAKSLLPIVRVPTNIVAEAIQYITGSVTGSFRAARAMRNGVENLHPDQADLIMRELKKGSLGVAALLIGYFNADNVGGYYKEDVKKKPGAAKYGSIKIGSLNIPSVLLHNPLMEVVQFGATIRHVADSMIHGEKRGLASGAWAAALGLIEETPFSREAVTFTKLFGSPEESTKARGELVKSVVVPQTVSFIAEQTDRGEKGVIPRKPTTVLEHIETGIPGLRQNVKRDVRRENRQH